MSHANVLPLGRRERLHRRGIRLEWLTISWNVVEAVVAIGAGVAAGSVALVGFGVDSGIEIISAVALLWRLKRAGPDAGAAEESSAERRALYVVAATFLLLAAFITVEAVGALAQGDSPESSAVGVALAAVSLAVMPTLAYLKQRTAASWGARRWRLTPSRHGFAPISRWRSWPVSGSTPRSVGSGPTRSERWRCSR